LVLAACNMNDIVSVLHGATKSKYSVGNCYSFKSRDFEPNASLTILKIEH
jgi:hypothetical protein